MKDDKENNVPAPKPRKHPELWQSYQLYDEMTRLIVRHKNRLSAAKDNRSNLDAQTEIMFATWLTEIKKNAKKTMIPYAKRVGPIWDWITSIKGLKDGALAAGLLAQIDDISSFDNVSQLWRFSGHAVIDGRAERNKPGEKSHFSRPLKTLCYLIGEQFIKQQTPLYSDIYYQEKERQRELHPEKERRMLDTGKQAVSRDGKPLWDYTDMHIHLIAMRKMRKIFLQHLWLKWRELEKLPTNEPYVKSVLGHSDIIPPP